jgi:hypothetical protein
MKKLILTFSLGVLAFALMGTSLVEAETDLMPISGLMRYVLVDPGTQWIDADGVLHIRGAMMEWEMLEGEGDVVGTGWGRYKANIHLASGDGDTQGYHSFEGTIGGVSGSWTGRADAIYTGFVMDGHYVGKGKGGLAGLQIRLHTVLVYSSGECTYDGYVFYPGEGGDDKKLPAEAKSWSSVKALFR